MTIPGSIWSIGFSLVLVGGASAQGFVNLDFESATLVPVAGDSYQAVQFAQAFPGWTMTIVGGIETNALYDVMFLDSAGIGIIDIKFQGPFVSPVLIGGRYTALLQSGIGHTSNGPLISDATLSQTGLVPLGTKSLRFRARAIFDSLGTFAVTLGGQTLSLTTLGSGTNYTLYGADVSQWAGQTAKLSFTVFGEIPHIEASLFLDDIQFSNQSVPTVPQTSLSASISGGNFHLSWTPPGGTLEFIPGLGPGYYWFTAGTQNPTNIPISDGVKFFRIRR